MDVHGVTATVEGIERRLQEHLAYLRGAALTCPPGGARPWDEALAHYGVPAEPAHLRVQAARRSGQRAGAVVVEFERAVSILARFAEEETSRSLSIDRLAEVAAVAPHVAQQVEMLRAQLRTMAQRESERYAREVGAEAPSTVASSVSSVFANAVSTAKLTPWANVTIDPATVLTCVTCGAPQEKPLDFKCRYCRNMMYAQR